MAVNDYTDEDMLKIMIRENSTQRGNENFGAVLDSVGAVLVQCVKETVSSWENNPMKIHGANPITNLQTGDGIGHKTIRTKEPSLSEHHIKAALSTFRSTGLYLSLLKKGGLPEEFHHLFPARSKP